METRLDGWIDTDRLEGRRRERLEARRGAVGGERSSIDL